MGLLLANSTEYTNLMKIIKIGRSTQNDVVINDPYVSGSHCQIIQDERGNFVLIDTNSSNGTYVNGVQRHGEVRLNPSDIVKVGNTILPWQTYFNNAVGYGSVATQNYGLQQNAPTKPDNNLIQAILCTLFLSLPFGIVSWVFAAKVDKQWEAGDYDGAIESAKKSKTWFWVGLGMAVFTYLMLILVNI